MIKIKEVDRRIAKRLMELGFDPEMTYPVYYLKLEKDKTLVELKKVKRYLQTNPSEEVVKKQYKQVCKRLKILTSKISRLRDQKRVLRYIIDN